MSNYKFPKEIRNLIISSLPEDTSLYGDKPELRYTYLPAGHAKALHPDNMLVVGIRGSGKSFWWAALQNEEHRSVAEKSSAQAGIKKGTIVSQGFGEPSSPNDYPGKDVLVNLLKLKFDARQIWRTIVLRHLAKNSVDFPATTLQEWPERIKWVQDHPEKVERLLYDIDNDLQSKNNYHLVLFDALDRTADDWQTMHDLVRGLLQVLLEFRSYKCLRPKAFLRPDHLEAPSVATFPDSSKILNQKVELNWPRNELYGLFWQHLANGTDSDAVFRDASHIAFNINWIQQNNVWAVPDKLRNDEQTQKNVFHAITGPWMGRDHRRGFPYSWLPGHLSDARGQVSPRSFISALRNAANDTNRPQHEYAIHFDSIKKGVQEASRIRVREMKEDYPWVETMMKPLSGLSVPCHFDEIISRWDNNRSLESLADSIQYESIKLPPTHIELGADGVRQDIEALGLFEKMKDDRVNLPDVYRVAYGIGRRGGVKAVKGK